MTDETNYCKQCGANLGNVRSALLSREPGESFDWKKTWIADMLLTDEERRRRQAAVELAADPEYVMAAEIKRRKELKAGIVTCFSGIGGAIFLAILGSAIAEAAGDPAARLILESLWAAGFVPFLVGLAIIFNTLFAHRLLHGTRRGGGAVEAGARAPGVSTGEVPALEAPPMPVSSVTEATTERMTEAEAIRRQRGREFS